MERERNKETEWKTTEEVKVKQHGTGIKNNRECKMKIAAIWHDSLWAIWIIVTFLETY